MRVAAAAVAIALAACGRFEDPNTVIDLRVLSIVADPPDQLVDVDLANPMPNPLDLLAQLGPTQVCALVSDPNFTRRLRWSMRVCNLDSAEHCNDPQYEIFPADGGCTQSPCLVDSLDVSIPMPELCAQIPADNRLLNVVIPTVQSDPFHGLGGITFGVVLVVGGEGADPSLDLYAAKQVSITPHIPITRTANKNPFLRPDEPLDASVNSATFMSMPMGRCIDQLAAGGTQLVVAPGDKVRIAPIEGDGARETYVVPTLDGQVATFTEALTYNWQAAGGGFSAGDTGGPHDAFGNAPPLYTDWTAPDAQYVPAAIDIPLWVVQRDERYGEAWYETCIRVDPDAPRP